MLFFHQCFYKRNLGIFKILACFEIEGKKARKRYQKHFHNNFSIKSIEIALPL